MTRWSRIGKSGKLFLRSLATGAEGAADICFADKRCSDSNLAGFRKAAPHVRMLLAVASLAVEPVEKLILEM